LDDIKVKRDSKYRIGTLKKFIDERFDEKGLRKIPDEEGKLIYRDNGNSRIAYADMWSIIFKLARTQWFEQYVKDWNWFNSDSGDDENDFSVENLMDLFNELKRA